MAERCRPKIPLEQSNKEERLRAEANAEFDEAFGEHEDLARMNDLFEEAFSGFNEDGEERDKEPKVVELVLNQDKDTAAAAQ